MLYHHISVFCWKIFLVLLVAAICLGPPIQAGIVWSIFAKTIGGHKVSPATNYLYGRIQSSAAAVSAQESVDRNVAQLSKATIQTLAGPIFVYQIYGKEDVRLFLLSAAFHALAGMMSFWSISFINPPPKNSISGDDPVTRMYWKASGIEGTLLYDTKSSWSLGDRFIVQANIHACTMYILRRRSRCGR